MNLFWHHDRWRGRAGRSPRCRSNNAAHRKTGLRRCWRAPAALWKTLTNVKGTRYTVLYAAPVCTLGMIAIAVATILCLQAVVRMAWPTLSIWENNPDFANYDLPVVTPPPWLEPPAGVPIPEPAPLTPEEQARAVEAAQKERARQYAEARSRERRAALEDLVQTACVLLVVVPLFWLHWRLLRSTPGDGPCDAEGRGW